MIFAVCGSQVSTDNVSFGHLMTEAVGYGYIDISQ